ncbi:hypothetical protein Tcan_15865 [Toxocara canis]|uniref:Uncharacterized protein n=1 Tax=Toxocara canis TaxID=6265 RepID=A0A0B2UZ97_TOXCA|nr:hypothetical protein Tcan_15865 [Toxocara canis]
MATNEEEERHRVVFPAHLPRHEIQLGKRIVMLQAGTGNLFCGLIVACNDRYVMVKVTDKEGIDYGMQRVRIDRANPEFSAWISEYKLFNITSQDCQQVDHQAVKIGHNNHGSEEAMVLSPKHGCQLH